MQIIVNCSIIINNKYLGGIFLENDELLLETNSINGNTKNIMIRNNCFVFQNKKTLFDGNSIKKILVFVNTVRKKYKNVNIPIILDLGNIEFKDKLTYIFLEIISYILINRYKMKVKVQFQCEHNIFTEGIASSPLLLIDDIKKKNTEKFLRKFTNELYKKHYRKVVVKPKKPDELSKLMDEVYFFIFHLGVEGKCAEELSEVVVELVGNASEHTDSECLIDIDVTDLYKKRDSNDLFLGINIAVINFSEKLFGDLVKRRILETNSQVIERYSLVYTAYQNHSASFDSHYTENDFFNIASFQHKISGDPEKTITGGTGLTKLISSLEKRSAAHECYLITGDRALLFFHEYLEYNSDRLIGFNKENDFVNVRPSDRVVAPSCIYMPGTAYNLNFIMVKEK